MDRALHRSPSQPGGAHRRGRRGFLGFGSLSCVGWALRLPAVFHVAASMCISVRCRARSWVAMLLAIVLLRRERAAIAGQVLKGQRVFSETPSSRSGLAAITADDLSSRRHRNYYRLSHSRTAGDARLHCILGVRRVAKSSGRLGSTGLAASSAAPAGVPVKKVSTAFHPY